MDIMKEQKSGAKTCDWEMSIEARLLGPVEESTGWGEYQRGVSFMFHSFSFIFTSPGWCPGLQWVRRLFGQVREVDPLYICLISDLRTRNERLAQQEDDTKKALKAEHHTMKKISSMRQWTKGRRRRRRRKKKSLLLRDFKRLFFVCKRRSGLKRTADGAVLAQSSPDLRLQTACLEFLSRWWIRVGEGRCSSGKIQVAWFAMTYWQSF